MAGSGKRGGGDRILESRHLVGLFLGVVLLCGVFFTLGWVMGRTQYTGAVHASDALVKTAPTPAVEKEKALADSVPSNSGEWDFYSKKDNNHLDPAVKESAPAVPADPAEAVASAPAPAAQPPDAAAKPPARFQPPKMAKGSLVLQITALSHESDALAMADALQQKKFPAFVSAPSTDNYYRVLVGPYPNEQAADAAKNALDRDGFKPFIKR